MNRSFRRLLAIAPLTGLFLLPGCGKFFVDPNGLGGTSTCSTNCIYIANSGTDDIAAFAATNPLKVVTSVNVGLSDTAITMAVTPDDDFLFAGSALGNIYSLPIQNGGALGAPTTAATPLATEEVRAIAIDNTGTNLLAALAVPITSSSCASGFVGILDDYTIGSDGTLTLAGTQASDGPCGTPTSLTVSADGNYVFMGLGTTGMEGFSYVPSTGVATAQAGLSITGDSTTQFNGVAVDPTSTYLFVAASGTSGGLSEYKIMMSGGSIPTYSLQLAGSTQDNGVSFYPVAVDPKAAVVYSANFTNGEVYGFTYGTGGLTAISGSPFSPSSAANGVNGLAVDSSGSFVLTVNQSGPNLQEFTINSSGALAAASTGTTSTGTYFPSALALSH